MRKILVTGGAGFVGRHLVMRLLAAGDEVHCVDSLVPGTGALDPRRPGAWPCASPFDFPRFHFHPVDCRDYFDRTADTDFDCTFHLAAVVGGRMVIENTPLMVAEDLAIDARYWQWAVRTRPAKSVCFSSSAVYPVRLQQRDSYVLLREDMVDFDRDLGVPDLVYGWAKLTNENLARIAHRTHGLRSVVYRPFSGYGEDQDTSYPFPDIVRRVLRERACSRIAVWGSGDQMRDFIHIEDCIDGILGTMDAIDDASALNLSTGTWTSFRAFVELAAEVLGFAPEVVGTEGTPEGVFARAGDTTKQAAHGFRAKVDLRTGVERALRALEASR